MSSPTSSPAPPRDRDLFLIASGDARTAANVAGWEAQQQLESTITEVAAGLGVSIQRAHDVDPALGHGFIDSQRRGMDVIGAIPDGAAIIVAEAVWQFSHHVLAGLLHHDGPTITIANWSGQWPGLVGLLNLNASLAKAGRAYSTTWTLGPDDAHFVAGLSEWLDHGTVTHDARHVTALADATTASANRELGARLAADLRARKAILGVFDEGCMGMFNAIFDDHLVHATGIFKERLSQAALVAEMETVTDDEAASVREWLEAKAFTFVLGDDDASELTATQVHAQCKMYIAAGRLADRYGCDAIGIQYQLGLADSVPASDLAEGLLNNIDRPPILRPDGSEIRPGKAIPHFNEVDQGVAVDLIATDAVWNELELDPSSTLHDVRWGEDWEFDHGTEFVWTFLISGSVPANHLVGGYAGARSERQPPMYFKLGGGTLTGVSRPGHVVWSRVYQLDNALHADLGLADAVELPAEETERRLEATTPQWPIMHAVLHGVTRDQFMARHMSNHVNVAYAPTAEAARAALETKAAMFDAMGITTSLCGVA